MNSYLAEVAGGINALQQGISIEQRVLSANPILEGFGNAKTVRNDNSSRFGRFSEVCLDSNLKITGAIIINYLLEKSRVTGPGPGERNYHIFYQLCCGNKAKTFGLEKGCSNFSYINDPRCATQVDGIDDEGEFSEIIGAFDELNFSAELQTAVLSTTAAVLHIGNISFELTERDNDGAQIVQECSRDDDLTAAEWVAGFLGVQSEALEHALITRKMSIARQDPVTVPLRPEQCLENRDALSKFLYDHMFDWLITRINEALATTGSVTKSFIGILDIFGFEIFDSNSFEQLCINLTNEKLQV